MWGQVQVPISLNCSIGISGEGMLGRRWLVCLLYMCGLTLMCHWSPSFCQARMPSYLMRIIVLTCSQFFFFFFFFLPTGLGRRTFYWSGCPWSQQGSYTPSSLIIVHLSLSGKGKLFLCGCMALIVRVPVWCDGFCCPHQAESGVI